MIAKVSAIHRRRAKIWLILALGLALLWVILWLSRDKDAQITIQKRSSAIVTDTHLPSRITALNDLSKEVQPLRIDEAGADAVDYSSEFQGRPFLEKNKDKWTVEVMNVEKAELIMDYLQTRPDRERFAYFRYLDKNKKEKYILIYDVVNTFQEALGTARTVKFNLPTKAIPERIGNYLNIIDGDYEEVAVQKPTTRPAATETVAQIPNEEPETATPAQAPQKLPQKTEEQPAPTPVSELPPAPEFNAPVKIEITNAEPAEIATPPTIKPTAEARPLEVIDAPPPIFEEDSP